MHLCAPRSTGGPLNVAGGKGGVRGEGACGRVLAYE